MSERVVIDTSVLVAALKSPGGASRAVLRLCLGRRCQPLIGGKLFAEYEDVFGRSELFKGSSLSEDERRQFLDAFLSVCRWIRVYFIWRPNLPDEGDNHLIELAVAGAATSLITHNVRDLRGGELKFPQLEIQTPGHFLEQWRQTHGDDDNPNA